MFTVPRVNNREADPVGTRNGNLVSRHGGGSFAYAPYATDLPVPISIECLPCFVSGRHEKLDSLET